MMKGRIVGSIAGFYHVKVGATTYLSKPRGIFRKKGFAPTVGDEVEVQVDENNEGTIIKILPRKNALIRPFVSNLDGAILVFSLKDPLPDLLLLDRLLINVSYRGIRPIILWTKKDLVSEKEKKSVKSLYEDLVTYYEISALEEKEVKTFFSELPEGVYLLAGQSGVGKSTIFNALNGELQEIGDISKKLKRGRHTTRNSVLIEVSEGRYLVDTPGFQNLQLDQDIEPIEIQDYYPEFQDKLCKFDNCIHRSEPHCGVKEAIGDTISETRYENYLYLLEEAEMKRSY